MVSVLAAWSAATVPRTGNYAPFGAFVFNAAEFFARGAAMSSFRGRIGTLGMTIVTDRSTRDPSTSHVTVGRQRIALNASGKR